MSSNQSQPSPVVLPTSQPATVSHPTTYAPSPAQLRELEALAREAGYQVVYTGERYVVLDNAVTIFGSRSLAATAGFLRGVRHVLRTAQVAARLAEQTGSEAASDAADKPAAGGAR